MTEKIANSLKMTALEKKWVLCDVGNSAYILLLSTIIPIYFDHLTGTAGLDAETGLIYFGYATSIATIAVAFLGPVLGTIADMKNMKNKLFALSVVVGAIACAAMGLATNWISYILIFILGKIACSLSIIFNDAMLTDVTSNERMDKVSSHGYAWGYAGSCIPFIVSLLFVLFYESIGISFTTAMIIAFAINGIWWAVMSTPLIKSYKQIHYVEADKISVAHTFTSLKATFMEMMADKKILFFVLAFFFYIDGVYTIIGMATAYGTALGLDSTALLLALLVTQLVAFPCALMFSRLSRTISSETLISVCIAGYFCIGIFAIFLSTEFEFWCLAIAVGFFQGGIQALSRSYFGKIIPPQKSSEYFGILDICGKGATFLGTMLVSLGTQITHNSSVGVACIAPLILIGFIFFRLAVKQPSTAKK